jgi:hypothetical protein
MSFQATVHKVFIASPGDVRAERRVARQVIDAWNEVNSERERAVLQAIGWDTHSYPEMGQRPQETINRLVINCDILVAIFWARLGSPTGVAESGTIEEIEKHLAAKKPTMIYFSNAPVPSEVDTAQLEQLRAFRAKYESQGLIGAFKGAKDFGRVFSQNLAARMVDYLGAQPRGVIVAPPSPVKRRSKPKFATAQMDPVFVPLPNQSLCAIDSQQSFTQVTACWYVKNRSAAPVKLFTARLLKPRLSDPTVRCDISTAKTWRFGEMFSDQHEIPPGETRRVLIHYFVGRLLEKPDELLKLTFTVTDDTGREHLPTIELRIRDLTPKTFARVIMRSCS